MSFHFLSSIICSIICCLTSVLPNTGDKTRCCQVQNEFDKALKCVVVCTKFGLVGGQILVVPVVYYNGQRISQPPILNNSKNTLVSAVEEQASVGSQELYLFT